MRGLLLLPAGALVLDQLRYFLAYGSHAEQVFRAQGHAYLSMLLPAIVALVALAVGGFATRFTAALRGEPVRDLPPPPTTTSLWGVATAALLSIHLVQESLEALLIPGNSGLRALAGPQALWALVAALLVGGALALLLRGAQTLISRAAARSRPGRFPRAAGPPPRRRRHTGRRLLSPLARRAAGRAPPRPLIA